MSNVFKRMSFMYNSTVDFRKYAEDMGASEVIIASMLKLDKNLSIQATGCMTLTNLSADGKCNIYERIFYDFNNCTFFLKNAPRNLTFSFLSRLISVN